MFQHLLHRLRQAAPVRVETVRKESLSESLIEELHAVSNALMAEDLAHFRVHALTNDLVHIFRRWDTGAAVGFVFWRVIPIDVPGGRVILGGKMRVRPEYRKRGLHLLSGLLFYAQDKLSHPRSHHYALSMVSLFGFVSIAQSLVRYSLFEPRNASPEAQAIRKAFLAMAEENHFRVDEETGLFHVNVFMTPETLSRYPATYFDQPLARAYAAINPDFRTNGSMVGLWLPLSADNLMSVARTVLRKLVRGAPPGHAPG